MLMLYVCYVTLRQKCPNTEFYLVRIWIFSRNVSKMIFTGDFQVLSLVIL